MASRSRHKHMICRGCWEQMHVPVPIRGPLSLPLRAFGIRRSAMHPDICTVCELMFSTVMRRRNVEVDLTILFADLRGYTALTQEISIEGMREILDLFYDECAAAIWAEDGLLNKSLGDGVMAIFNFPMTHSDHPLRAARAAQEIRRRCSDAFAAVATRLDINPVRLSVGIGVHTGLTSFGEFGRVRKDVTAMGSVVNLTSRLQSAAAAWEVIVSRQVLEATSNSLEVRGERECTLKGFAAPMTAYLV